MRDFLIGKDAGPMVALAEESGVLVHRGIVEDWRRLKESALGGGFDMAVASGYRGFERQRDIWNAKARGDRQILDAGGLPLDPISLDREDILESMLLWSALPGASRHHWGTEVDVFDRRALVPGQCVRLCPDEAAPGGPFAAFHRWLDEAISLGRSFGFYRPYERDLGGVRPEAWHLSYAPLSSDYGRLYDRDFFLDFLASADSKDIAFIDLVCDRAEAIFDRFVSNISPCKISGQ